ncbi:MAG: response regulator [Elusimicrobiota bacterium]|nr:response regulator [Elusimicrobiota bacterium]
MARRKILVVDDEKYVVELIRDILETGGYRVIPAYSAKEALEKVYTESPDLILLDILMPRVDGYQVCRQIREDLLLSNIPIIMLTVKGGEKDEIKGLGSGADDYIVKPFRPGVLLARVKMVLKRTLRGLEANPLTRLPGNTAIIEEIEERIDSEKLYAVLYFDLDNFKAFNDRYSFPLGDKVIQQTARIIIENMKELGNADDFVGHIGGDDFIAITTPDKVDLVCSRIIKSFDKKIVKFYPPKDQTRGYISGKDRQGNVIKFPIMTITIGVVTNTKRKFGHKGQIAAVGAELKKHVKSLEGSNYIIDRRAK